MRLKVYKLSDEKLFCESVGPDGKHDGMFRIELSSAELEAMKVRSPDLEIVEAPPGPAPEMGWGVRLYHGTEVCRAPQGLTPEVATDTSNWPEGFHPTPVQDDLQDGDVVMVQSLSGLLVGTVRADTDDGTHLFYSASKRTWDHLYFAGDERKCWVCHGLFMMDGLKSLGVRR